MFNSSDQLMFQCQSRQFQIQRNNYNDHNLGSNGQELAPNCPRCASPNTKFCYYNNYSLSQPRYFCKGCRRYWTKGGSLRNVPVGGGCRKSRRANSKYRVPSVYSQHSNADSSSIQEGSNEGGTDIDLAVVFSKFLNEDNSSPVVSEGNVDQIDQFGVNNMSNSPTLESYQSHQSGSIQDSDFFDGLTDQVLENGFGFENSGGNDQMGLWIDDVSWDSGLMQFDHHQQDLDYGFPNLLDDQIKISANLLNQENWSSFDISGFNYS